MTKQLLLIFSLGIGSMYGMYDASHTKYPHLLKLLNSSDNQYINASASSAEVQYNNSDYVTLIITKNDVTYNDNKILHSDIKATIAQHSVNAAEKFNEKQQGIVLVVISYIDQTTPINEHASLFLPIKNIIYRPTERAIVRIYDQNDKELQCIKDTHITQKWAINMPSVIMYAGILGALLLVKPLAKYVHSK